MPTKSIEHGPGTLTIDGQTWTGPITDFTFEPEKASEAIQQHIMDTYKLNTALNGLAMTCTIARTTMLKLMGIWQWVVDNCPSGRVRHLMLHGSERVKSKNFNHAIRLINRSLKKED